MMRWDKELDIIINKLSIKYSVDTNTVKDVVATFFSTIKKVIQHPSMPTILIHNFGKFTPSLKKLNAAKQGLENKLTGDLSEEDRIKCEEKLERIQVVICRLENEKTTRNDEEE